MAAKPISSIETTEEFYKGYKAESIIAHILRHEGYYVHITADLQERGRNGAPGSRSDNGFITLPDLDVARQGYRGFVEVKYKAKADYTNITDRPEHGIPIRQFRMYWRAQSEFGTTVFLCIYEGATGAVRFAALDELIPKRFVREQVSKVMEFIKCNPDDALPIARLYWGNKLNPGGMVYFAETAFTLWGNVAVANGEIYKQLSFVEQGESIFKVVRYEMT